MSDIFKLFQNIFILIIITGLPAAEVQKFYKITPFSTFSEISELWMAGKPFIMMGLIKVWGVFKRSDKYPFRGMKQKKLILRDIFRPRVGLFLSSIKKC